MRMAQGELTIRRIINDSTEIDGARDGGCRPQERRLSALPSSDGTSPPPGLTAGRERNGAVILLPPRQPMKEHPVTERIQPRHRPDNQPNAEQADQPTGLDESAAQTPTEQAPTADASPTDPAVEAVASTATNTSQTQADVESSKEPEPGEPAGQYVEQSTEKSSDESASPASEDPAQTEQPAETVQAAEAPRRTPHRLLPRFPPLQRHRGARRAGR